MLEIILQLVCTTKNVFNFLLLLSFKTGQLLVYFLNSLVQALATLHRSISGGVQVFIEDFGVFVYDVLQQLKFVGSTVDAIYTAVYQVLTTISNAIVFIILSVVEIGNTIIGAVGKIANTLGYTAQTLKWFVVLVSSGVWFAITVIPTFVVYVLTMLVYLIGRMINEVFEVLLYVLRTASECATSFINYFIEVPFEAVAGLFVITLFVYIIRKYKDAAIEMYQLQRQRYREVTPELTSESEDEVSSSKDVNQERLCVICQTRLKCVLMLPCKHVCICDICNEQLSNYSRNCPLCRVFVQRTMSVYM